MDVDVNRLAPDDEERCSWLLARASDRERMVDMDRRLQPVRKVALAVLAVALVACGPWLGYWTLLPLIVAGVLFSLADRGIERTDRPEYGIFAAWAGSQVVIAVAVLFARCAAVSASHCDGSMQYA